jgi:hypothetical protein
MKGRAGRRLPRCADSSGLEQEAARALSFSSAGIRKARMLTLGRFAGGGRSGTDEADESSSPARGAGGRCG